jgi:hypothetical protein
MIITLARYFWNNVRLQNEKLLMTAQLSSLMLEMDHLNVEVLLKYVELSQLGDESCKNVILLFWKSTHQIICSDCIINHNVTTHVKVVLAKEYCLCSVRTKQYYEFGIDFLSQLFIICCFQSNASTDSSVIVFD